MTLIICLLLAGCAYQSKTKISGKDMKYGLAKGKDLIIERETYFEVGCRCNNPRNTHQQNMELAE